MAQFLRPDSDIAVGTWTTTPLFSKVNDQSTVTFIHSSNANGDTCTLGLSDPAAAPQAGSVFINVIASKPETGGNDPTLDITVLQGGVAVQTFTVTLSTAAWTTYRFQVTNAITNFNTLSVSLNRYGGGNPSQRKTADVAEVSLEIPDPAAVNVTASAGLISFVETIPVATVSAQQSVTASAGLISFTETLYDVSISLVSQVHVTVPSDPILYSLTLLETTVATQVSTVATAGLISLNESIFEVAVEAIIAGSETVLYRVDCGTNDAFTPAVDGGINWEQDYTNAYSQYNVTKIGEHFTRKGDSPDTFDFSLVDTSVYPEIVFKSEMSDRQASAPEYRFEFPISQDGNYRLDILLMELYQTEVAARIFDIYVNDVLEWDGIDLVALYGFKVAAIHSKTVSLTAGSTLSVNTSHGGANNPAITGLQVVKIETGGGVIAGADVISFLETVPAVTVATVQNTAVTAGLIEINETVYDAAVSTGINITIPSEPILIDATLLEITISTVKNTVAAAGLIEFISATGAATVTTQKAVTIPAGLLQFDVAIGAAAVSTEVSVTAAVDAVGFTANIPAATTSTEVNVIAAAATIDFISTVFEANSTVEVHTTISADTAAFNFSLPQVNVSAGGSATIIPDGNLYQIGVPEASVNAQKSVTVDLGVISHQISLQEAYASTSGAVLVSLDAVHFETEILPVNLLKSVTVPAGEINLQVDLQPVTVSSGASVAVAALVSEFEIGLEPVTIATSAQAIVDVESLGIVVTAEEVQIITSGEVIAAVDALEFQTEVFNVLVNPAPPTVSEGNVMLSGSGRVILFRGRY